MTTAIATKAIRNSIFALLALVLAGQAAWAEDAAVPTAAPAEASTPAPATTDSATVAPDDSALREDHPDSYLVKKGDNLWDIASRFLKNPWMWPEIWHVNPQIANPHLIYPGDTIKLIYLEGQPKLTVKRGEAGMTYKMSPVNPSDTGETATAVAGSASATETTGQATAAGKGEDKRLKPTVRVGPLEEPIPAIPLNVISPFLVGNRIVSSGVLEAAPYVVQGGQEHVIAGAGGEVYARGSFDAKSSIYGIFRKGEVYVDPDTREILGVEALDIGTGKIRSISKDMARLEVVRSTQEILPADRLLVNQERRVESIFYPVVPEVNIRGKIISVANGVSQIGNMSVVVINRGERDELRSSQVLAIYQSGEVVRDPVTEKSIQLPEERAGLLMVFATFEKLSYGLVLYADRPLRVGDMVRKP